MFQNWSLNTGIHILIEDIYIFDVNTKYISLSVLKTSEFHECAAQMKISMFSTHEITYIWYLLKKEIFFLFYTFLEDLQFIN